MMPQMRDWYWRGWQVSYCTLSPDRPPESGSPLYPPLICLHGFGASSYHWRQNLPVWGQYTTVYALDLLGFGASQKAAAPYSPVFWGEMVQDFWRTFVGEPVVLVGNSLGSVVAMTVAVQAPAMVRGLVWVNLPDNSVLLPDLPVMVTKLMRGLQRWGRPLGQAMQLALTGPWLINPLLALVRSPRILYPALASAYGETAVVDEGLRQMVSAPARDRHAAQALRFISRGMAQVPPPYRAKQVLPQLQVPLLLLWGQADRLVPPLLAARCGALNPRLQLIMVDGAGHCLQDECPDRVNTWVLDWLQTVVMGSSWVST